MKHIVVVGGGAGGLGLVAKLFYLSLYRMHQIALHGYIRTGCLMLAGRVQKVMRGMIKLHQVTVIVGSGFL